jgi:phage terminase large subunit-like protein
MPQRQQEVQKVLEGTVEKDRIFGIIYQSDPEVDWTTHDALRMANPNLGISNDEEALLLDQAEAARNPAKQNIFRCKHLHQWMTAATAWMNMHAWAKCYDENMDVAGMDCWLGSDLASKLDLAATVRLFRSDQHSKPHY